ncbi:MAG: outer membrane beta-barrel protein, partial [Bdellovibrionota bacterium]
GEFGLWSITLRPELNYVTKSYTVANVADVKNHFIEVPVFLKFNPLGSFPVSPFILVGPQWSKQTSADVTTVAGATSYTNTATGWDIAAVAGLGVELNVMGSVGLEVQGRYAYGFRNIDSTSAEVKTRAFYALAGLSFAL